ncbi:AAA domain-containing protein [Streptomyces antibioticus]|uniref:AAA domain-containing protein n=1 Tax=Streptomyces antibioticus TaxID=1890 RepID=UPI00369A576F
MCGSVKTTRLPGVFSWNGWGRWGESNHPVRAEHAAWTLGRGGPGPGKPAGAATQWVANRASLQLNPRQRQAVEQALNGDALFLWGLLGTGKTDVVGHIAEGCYSQGHSVLFLAPTNVAVDQALERICELLSRDRPPGRDRPAQKSGSRRRRAASATDSGNSSRAWSTRCTASRAVSAPSSSWTRRQGLAPIPVTSSKAQDRPRTPAPSSAHGLCGRGRRDWPSEWRTGSE